MNNCIQVPFKLNTPQNRIIVYPTVVNLFSDVNVCPVGFYENDGKYWFCIEYSVCINSSPFVSLRNCVSGLESTAKFLGFTIKDSESLADFVKSYEKTGKLHKGVA